ncbi:MAG: pantoate--beta-alanine ligase [Gammaproteobacteria bacterium]|nr:pantoate--beta-alanine ligase [Gammaproteobacteria bacterium]
MITLTTIADLRRQVRGWRADGKRIALVPTMGNLHAGHLTLVRRARELADRVVVSIFVNPLQFGAGEDFEGYPRTMEQDAAALVAAGADLLFSPSVTEVYSKPQEQQTRVEVPGISDILCGASRPGHFVGVATVVCKLFNMVQPDLALFGDKDYQQLLVIRSMVQDLCIPVEIVGVLTVRDENGLALSSRNGYLTAAERKQAPELRRIMLKTAVAIESGSRDYTGLEEKAKLELEKAGFNPDYYTIRSAVDLSEPTDKMSDLVVLVAAYLGKARLIDNLQAHSPPG